MNELSFILMSFVGKKIIMKVIIFYWLRINIGIINFVELMMVNYMKVKLIECRIGCIVVRVLNLFVCECVIIIFCVVCVNLFIIIKWKMCLFLFFFLVDYLVWDRIFGFLCKVLLVYGGKFLFIKEF